MAYLSESRQRIRRELQQAPIARHEGRVLTQSQTDTTTMDSGDELGTLDIYPHFDTQLSAV